MSRMKRPTRPVGLYDPTYEHDACGVALVARLDGKPTHETVRRAIVALENLEHRGAAGADPNTGDGAGILLQLPDAFIRGVLEEDLPPPGAYGVCVCFLPQDDARRAELEELLARTVEDEGQRVVAWRDVPVDKDYVGITANFFAPYVKHLVVAASDELAADQDAFERKLYVIRRVAEIAAGPDLVIPSFSSRTIVYKGMLTSPQLLGYYPDLQDQRTESALGLVHSRFSTNTFPSWELAHPYRMIAHNGEINTLRGNVNWMRARESQLASELFGDDLQKVLPIVRPGGSDSATFDNVLELLTLAGRSLPHAVMMMIPEAYADRDDIPEHLRGFYAFHSCLMEPWDGPAAVAFTDGRVIGATLDRNGLRPGRWLETKDGWVVLGSETGVMDEPASNILRKGRLQPGKLFLVDLAEGAIVADEDVKREISTQQPYGEWFEDGVVHLGDLPEREPAYGDPAPVRERQLAFGYSQEDLRVLLAPTAARGEEPIGSMGNDAALAVLSDRQPPLFSYFKQLFAQVTNPPIDPIREAIVMSVGTGVGLRAQPARRDARARPPALDEDADPAQRRAREAPAGRLERLPRPHDRHHVAVRRGARGHGEGRRPGVRGGDARARRRRQRPDPVRPELGPRAGADPVAAGGRLGPPPPGPRGHAPADRPRARVRRAARGAPLRDADRLRRQRHQPVPDVRVAGRAGRGRPRPGRRRRRDGRDQRRQGHRQGPAQDDLQDGDLDDPVLQRRADLRGRRPRQGPDRPRVRRHGVAHRRHRDRRAGPGDAREARARPTRGRPRTCCRSAASTRGAARASTTCGTRRRSRSSSTPSATAASPLTRSTRGSSTTTRRRARPCAGCSSSRSCPRRTGSRSTTSSRPPTSSGASRPAPCRSARCRARRTRRWPSP